MVGYLWACGQQGRSVNSKQGACRVRPKSRGKRKMTLIEKYEKEIQQNSTKES
jgi:hypothetical protein